MTYHEAVAELRRLGTDHLVIGTPDAGYQVIEKAEALIRRRELFAVATLTCGHSIPSPPPHEAVGQIAYCWFCHAHWTVQSKR